jgi:hypothetical protein
MRMQANVWEWESPGQPQLWVGSDSRSDSRSFGTKDSRSFGMPGLRGSDSRSVIYTFLIGCR